MKIRHKKTWLIVGIVLLLIIIRILLPYFIKYEINKMLANLDGYYGHVEDVDLNLYRGAYAIDFIEIYEKEDDRPDIAFFKAETIDFSVEWSALFDGEIVGEVIALNPVLNFYTKPGGEVETGEENDWIATVKEFMPLTINRLEVINGQVNYIDKYSSPQVDLDFSTMYGVVTNLTNATDSVSTLPSNVEVRSKVVGDGEFHLSGRVNALKEIPDFDMDLTIEGVELVKLNDFFKAYAKFDVEEGRFDFYSEVVLINSELKGYVKPIITDIKVLDWKNENESLLGTIYQAVVGLAAEVLESHGEKEQVASKVPISGTLDTTKASVWPAIFSLLKNAFINPLKGKVDQSLKFQGGVSLSGDDLSEEEQKAFEKRQKQEKKEEKKRKKKDKDGGFLGL